MISMTFICSLSDVVLIDLNLIKQDLMLENVIKWELRFRFIQKCLIICTVA